MRPVKIVLDSETQKEDNLYKAKPQEDQGGRLGKQFYPSGFDNKGSQKNPCSGEEVMTGER